MTYKIKGFDPKLKAKIVDSAYRSASGISQSSLKKFIKSPAHYLASTEITQEPTKAMTLGSAFHAFCLQNNNRDDNPYIAVKKKMDGRSKEGKLYNEQFSIENEGKFIVDEDEFLMLDAMHSSICSHDTAGKYLRAVSSGDGMREFAMFAVADTETPVTLKGLVDGYDPESGTIIDLKTCEDASPAGFRKAIWDRKYDLQSVHYAWLAKQNNLEVNQFVFIAVEKEPPFAVGCYVISQESIKKSISIWESAVTDISECMQSGKYPAYSSDVVEISL